jgi:hypothetical protein
MYHYLAFEPFDKRGAYAYQTVDEWEAITLGAMDVIKTPISKLSDRSLKLMEWEFIEKMAVCWRDKGRGNLVQSEELVVKNEEQAKWLTPELKTTGLRYASAIEGMSHHRARMLYDSNKVPIRRGKGSPYWFPGTDRKAAVMLAKISQIAQNLTDLDRMLVEAGSAVLKPSITTYIRVQAARKASLDYQLVAGTLANPFERVKPKIRKIQALPFSYNFPVVGVAGVLRYLLKTVTDANTGTIGPAQTAAREYRYCIAADLSTYDDTVSIETLKTYRTYVLEPSLRACLRKGLIDQKRLKLILEIDEAIQVIEALTPPPTETEGARLVRTEGGIKSGERLTSQKGSDINRCRIYTKMRDLRITGQAFNLGDDTIVCSDNAELKDKWFKEDYDNRGFIETLADDVSFLMKRIPEGYAYLGRMVMSSINREPQKEPQNIFGAASAMKIRRALLKGHPLEDCYHRALETCRGPLQEASVLARVTDERDLLSSMVNNLPRGSTEKMDDAVEHIMRAQQAGLIAYEDAIRMAQSMEELGGRTQLTYAELNELARETPLNAARSYIRESAYTRMLRKRVAA